MQDPTSVDDRAILKQEKENKVQIDAIDRLLSEISMQHDSRDMISLEDIQRI